MFPEMQLWLKVLLAMAVAALAAFGATPTVKSFATKVGAIDVPDHKRRIHDHPIPRMGGMAIFLGFIISVLLFVRVDTPVQGILIGAVIIVATGVVDDIIQLKWYIKLGAQVVAAMVAIAHGVVIQGLMNPNVFSPHETLVTIGVLSIPITLFWIVVIVLVVWLFIILSELIYQVLPFITVCKFVSNFFKERKAFREARQMKA